MSSKITNFFNIKPKLSTIDEEVSNIPKTRECKVILNDIKYQFDGLKKHQKIHERNHRKDFKCQRCDYATDNNYHYQRHQEFHVHQDKKFAAIRNPLKCAQCATICKDKLALRNHILNVHPKELYQCDLCARFIKVRKTLIRHINVHIRRNVNFFKIKPKIDEEVSKSTKIKECQVILKDIKHQFGNNDLKLFEEISLKEIKSCKKGTNICKFCGKKLSSELKLKQHMKNIHPTEFDLFNCEMCNRRFFKKIYLEVHMKKKHPGGQIDQFECDFDGKIFKTKGEISFHMGCHLPLVECQICHKMLKFKSIDSHMTNFHASKNQFQCKICDKKFKSTQHLRIHEKIHDKQFKCDICSKMYPTNTQLNQHKKKYHQNPGSFECEICGKKFNRAYCLKSHQKTHNKNRPKSLQCQRCDHATDNKNSFKKHQKFHENQDIKFASMKNPLKCEKCPTFCKDKKTLYMHMRQVHPKESFQCDLCAKFIKKKESLVIHVNNHIRTNNKV
ncbi:zinc finger protein 260-like [Chironomus tepperi]|uniref:zinc finger protein 260-like n=1 Tax=Chironomus tepperi TaxID=113505 RepID=UPI00391EF6F7